MYKRIIAALLALFLLGTLASCKMITDGILKGIFGKDIEVGEGGITIKDKDGDITIGGGKWPKGKAADNLPEFKHGKIISIVNANDSLMVLVEDVKENQYRDYVQQVKQKGYTEEQEEYEVQGYSLSYVASKGNAKVGVVYSVSTETLTITLEISKD